MTDPVATLEPITLPELLGAAALQERAERKYVVSRENLEALLARLLETHRVLEIDDRRAFRYETTYYDTPELRTLRDHVQGRRRRYKLRRRTYLDSGQSVVEVKLKGRRGLTVKHALPTEPGELTDAERAFFADRVREAYGIDVHADLLEPVLTTRNTRLTLAAPDRGERLTADIALDLQGARLLPGYAIVESKSAGRGATADRVLRELGVRPARRLSKFVLGAGSLHPEIPLNDFLPLRAYFAPPLPAAALVPRPTPA